MDNIKYIGIGFTTGQKATINATKSEFKALTPLKHKLTYM